MFAGSNILVAGGSGFIGTNLVKRLIMLDPAGIRIPLHKRFAQIDGSAGLLNFTVADLTQKKDCQDVVRDIDYVFMCAANTSGAAVMAESPLSHVTPNILMNSLLLEAAYRAKVKKFLFISSSTVYPLSDESMTEDMGFEGEPFKKYFCVGWMKRFSELLCQMYGTADKPMEVAVVRPANVYGPYDDFEWETSHVVPALIRKVVKRHNPIEVWGDGKDIKDFIYVEDLVDGMILAMENRDKPFYVVNLASGRSVTVRDILNALIDIEKYNDAKIVYNSNKPSMIPKRLVDTSKAREVLGFSANTPLHSGLLSTIQWYKKQEKENIHGKGS